MKKFADNIAHIDTHYTHTPTAFKNGEQYNSAQENQGSAKIFAFAQLNQLSEQQTLELFAEHYDSVIADPTGTAHQNIRQFLKHGWQGITFEGQALTTK
ncbi:HopJ type III effector protein [Acinetobacter sp. HY1485]|uniref:HopJ type III effector protein n=1 Tax=Acinetobacter sp. HY1485 TaxID=2970918 RepID=UPI0022B9B9D4|nr:HopJ type III effector protein [Acinetobacter sp. HY1485]